MPNETIRTITEWRDAIEHALLLALVGLLLGIGQMLKSKERLTWRIILGRCLTTAGLGMAAGSVLLVFPGVPLVAQIGVAAALASLGTSALERLIQKALGVSVAGGKQ